MFPNFEFIKELRGGNYKSNYCVRQNDEDDEEGELLCLKVMHPGSTGRERFQREIEILGKLGSHPNLAQLIMENEMIYQGSKIQFFCETFIEGTDLEDKLESKPWTLKRSCLFMAQVCDGLYALEKSKVIHRDLKPTNIRVTLEDKPVLIDLGIAKALELPSLTNASDDQPGTPAYLSPEQARNDAEKICSATDLHAVGIILYRLLTGNHPFYTEGMSGEDVTLRIIHSEDFKDQPAFLQLSPEIRKITIKLLEKEPENRPASASIVARELRRIISESSENSTGGLLDVSLSLSTLSISAALVLSSLDEENLIKSATDDNLKAKGTALLDLLKLLPNFPDGEDPFLAMVRNGKPFIEELKTRGVVDCPVEIGGMLAIGACWQTLSKDAIESLEWPKPELCRLALELGRTYFPPDTFTRPPLKKVLRDSVDALPEHHIDWDFKALLKAFCTGLSLDSDTLIRPEIRQAIETYFKNLKLQVNEKEDSDKNRQYNLSATSTVTLELGTKNETPQGTNEPHDTSENQ